MQKQDKTQGAHAPLAPPMEFYLPLGGGTDPDFYLPADRVPAPGRFRAGSMASLCALIAGRDNAAMRQGTNHGELCFNPI